MTDRAVERVNIAHPELPGRVVSVPAVALHHHERAGWFLALPDPPSEVDDNPEGETGETGQSPETSEET